MSHIARRSLASLAPLPSSIAGPSTPSLSTLPLAVQKRRTLSPSSSPPSLFPLLKRTPKVLPGKLEAEFQALRLNGQYKGDEASGRRAFLKGQVAWRSRIRGIGRKKADFFNTISQGVMEDGVEGLDEELDLPIEDQGRVTGQRVYLPNIQIRLMRNHTPPGEAYDPTIATFRIPQSMTKTDLRSYLSAVYNLPVTFVRTDNYMAPVKRIAGGQIKRIGGSMKTYKRAVVGLVEPFHYPDDIEELAAQGQAMGLGDALVERRKKWLNDNFMVEQMKEYKKKALMKYYKGYRWRGKTHDNEGNTMREIMKKRSEREERVREEVTKMRSEGEVVTI